MTELQPYIEKMRMLFVQHAPADMLREAIPFGLLCLVAGIGLSVLGAKLSRFGLTSAFAAVGGVAGVAIGRRTGFPVPVCGLLGAVMAGIVGYQTFRLWVGVVAASVLTAVALGAFGAQSVAPHLREFQAAHGPVVASSPEDVSFALPSPADQQAMQQQTPRQWLGELWTFAKEKDAHLERNGRAIALAAWLSGLLFGVLAMRTALIVSTSVMGTALVATATGTLLTHFVPQSYQALDKNPTLIGVAFGAFLVGSLVVQTLLTRKPPSPEKKPKT